jgi:hypothetical protein
MRPQTNRSRATAQENARPTRQRASRAKLKATRQCQATMILQARTAGLKALP